MRERGLHFVARASRRRRRRAERSVDHARRSRVLQVARPSAEENLRRTSTCPCCTHIAPTDRATSSRCAQRHRVLRHAADRRAYQLLRDGRKSAGEIADVLPSEKGDLDSYLMRSPRGCASRRQDRQPLSSHLDEAEQKYALTVQVALDLGVPVTHREAVFRRALVGFRHSAQGDHVWLRASSVKTK